MANSDEGKGGRNVTEVHESVTAKGTKVQLGLWNAGSVHTSVLGTWYHGLLACTLEHGKVSTKLMIILFVNGLQLASKKCQH